MAGVNAKRETLLGELVTPIRENADVPQNEGPHQRKKIADGIPSNPSVDEEPETVVESKEEKSDEDSAEESDSE